MPLKTSDFNDPACIQFAPTFVLVRAIKQEKAGQIILANNRRKQALFVVVRDCDGPAWHGRLDQGDFVIAPQFAGLLVDNLIEGQTHFLLNTETDILGIIDSSTSRAALIRESFVATNEQQQ